MILLGDFLQREYGDKLYKLSFDIGCTCPNRDGTIASGGCVFCSEGGSGDFAERVREISDIDAAVENAKRRVRNKSKSGRYIAYFQAYTNTYGDVGRLEAVYREFQKREDIEILSIATRPDCLGTDVLWMLERLKRVKPLWVELGLQTVKEETAERIRRGYKLPVFELAYRELKQRDIPVIVHVILGLPGETKEDMRATISYLSGLVPPLDGIKLSLMHVLRGTELAAEFEAGTADLYEFTPEDYAEFVAELLGMLPEDTVVHRMTGDGNKRDLIYPLWSADKKKVLNLLNCKLAGLLV